jgi:hypothetical protein
MRSELILARIGISEIVCVLRPKKVFAVTVQAGDNFRMSQYKIGDRVRIRGMVYSDCLGITGTILEVGQSAMFGPRIQRCKVDFNGKVRRILSIHLSPAAKAGNSTSAAA